MTSAPTHFPRAFGVHAPDRPGDGPYGYRKSGLRLRTELLGMRDGGGAPCHWKVRDEAWLWQEGRIPEPDDAQRLLLQDCLELNFQPVAAYCPFTLDRPGTELSLQGKRSALSEAMRRFMLSLPRGSAVMFGNERERAWKGDPETWFELEAEFGFLARKDGMLWYVGGDLVEATTIETIKDRQAAWKRYGVEPDRLAFHSYGQSGTLARHVRDIWEALKRVTGRSWKLIWTEWGWGFPGEGKTRTDRRDLDMPETGAWNAEFALALCDAEIQADGCFFTLDQDFDQEGNPTAAAQEFADAVKSGMAVDPRVPPVQKAKEKTRRYLSIGRNALSAYFTRLVNI